MRSRSLRRPTALAIACAAMVVACGTGADRDADVAAGSTTEATSIPTTTASEPTPGDDIVSVASVTADGLTVEITPAEIRMATPDTVVCAEEFDDTATIRATLGDDLRAEDAEDTDTVADAVEVSWTDPAGTERSRSMTEDGDAFTIELGPFRAARDSNDRIVTVVVTALDDAGRSLATATVDAVVYGPDGCSRIKEARARERDRATQPTRPDGSAARMTVSTSPSPLVLWATANGTCPSGPTTGTVTATPNVDVDRVGARLTASGTTLDTTTLTRNTNGTWTGTIGPITARRGMDDRTPLRLEITATSGTRALTTSTTATLVRPEPCTDTSDTDTSDTDTSDTETDGGSAGTPSIAVSTSPSPLVLWATANGTCPSGPTTGTVTATPNVDVDRVGARLTASGTTLDTTTLTRNTNGTWTGTIGPITARRGMDDRTPLRLEITATSGTRALTTSTTATLVRPEPCSRPGAPTTPTTTPAAPPPPPPAATAPTTTTATTPTPTTPAPTTTTTTLAPPTTPAPTTTTSPPPPPPPPAPTVSVSTGSSQVFATIDGACPTGPTTLNVGARTSGDITSVSGRARLATGATVTLNFSPAGANRFAAGIGPIPGVPSMPATSTIDIQVRVVDSLGREATGTASATLVRPAPCAP